MPSFNWGLRIRECDSKLHATSLKKTSVSSEQPKRPMSPAIRRGSEQHTTGTNAYPVTATFTSQQVTGSNPTPSLSPQNGACMTPPNLSASAIVYTSSSHGVSTKLCAPEHSTKAQLVVHSPSNLDPHNESSNQLPVTRTRDPRRRPTVVNESTASFSRTSAVARGNVIFAITCAGILTCNLGTPFELSRTQPSTYVAHDNSGPCISTSTQAYDQSFPEPASKSLQGSAVSTSLPDGRTAKLPSNANPSTAPPAVDLQSHGVQKGTAMPMDDPPRTPERFGQQKPNGTPVGQSNESKPSNASSLSTSKSLVQATSACTGKNSNRPGYADEKVGPTEPCPTIPAKRPRTSDEDDAGGKKVPKLKPLGGLFIPSRRSSASALSLTKQRNPTGVRASKNTTGEPKDITKASKASCSSSSDATTALHAKIRFMEKQLDKDFSRLNRLFNDGDEDEPVTVATLEKKINYLLRNCNATLNTAGSGSSTPCSMDIDPSSTEADSRLKRGNDSSKVHSNWQEAIYELRRRLEEVELEKCHLDEDLKNAREAHSTEERRRCVAEKNRDTLSEHLKFSESLRKDLEDELAQLSKDWELEKQKGLRADEKVASLEKALTNVIADKDETSTQLCGALRERKRLEERLGIAEEASSEGTKKLEVARFEKARVEEQLCIVSSELEAARSSLLMTEEDIKQSNDGRASADKMVSELKGEIANLQQSHIRLTEDLRRAAEESFKASRADLEKAGAELRRVSSEKEEEVAGLQKEISERLSALHLSQSYSLQVGGGLRLTQEVLDKEKRMNQALEQRLSDIQGTVVVQEAMHSVDRRSF